MIAQGGDVGDILADEAAMRILQAKVKAGGGKSQIHFMILLTR
jgi:hypothetical protein